MDRDLLTQLAKRGAEVRLAELLKEVAVLEGLVRGDETPKASTLPRDSQMANDTAPRKRRKKMSAEQRAAHSKRMKAFWAARRAEQ